MERDTTINHDSYFSEDWFFFFDWSYLIMLSFSAPNYGHQNISTKDRYLRLLNLRAVLAHLKITLSSRWLH